MFAQQGAFAFYPLAELSGGHPRHPAAADGAVAGAGADRRAALAGLPATGLAAGRRRPDRAPVLRGRSRSCRRSTSTGSTPRPWRCRSCWPPPTSGCPSTGGGSRCAASSPCSVAPTSVWPWPASGVLLMVQGHRRRGAIAAVAGTAWCFGFLFLLQPHIGHNGVTQLAAYASYGNTPLSVAWGMLAHPVRHARQRAQPRELPADGVPVRARAVPALPVAPIPAAGGAAPGAVPGRRRVAGHARYGPQAIAITAFIFLATPMGLARLGRPSVERVNVDRRVLITLLAASFSFYVAPRAELVLRAAVGLGEPRRGRRRPPRGPRLDQPATPTSGPARRC